jgi:hypothetical protein
MTKLTLLAATFVSLLGTAVLTAADKPADTKEKTPATKPADGKGDSSKPAINKFCAVEGGDKAVDQDAWVIYKGLKIGFCCEDCVKEFNSDPDAYMAKLKARKDGIK